VLAALDELGPVSQVELGRAAGLDRSDVAATVAALEQRGSIRRAVDPDDLRRKRVALTPAGRRLLTRLDTVLDGVQQQVLEPLSATQRDTLVALLARLGQ
jgi:DNA-binding MarR family transcriptional regulator